MRFLGMWAWVGDQGLDYPQQSTFQFGKYFSVFALFEPHGDFFMFGRRQFREDKALGGNSVGRGVRLPGFESWLLWFLLCNLKQAT